MEGSTTPRADPPALLARLDAALEGIERVPSLDPRRFLETHVLYEGRSDQQARIIDWFAREVGPALPDPGDCSVLSVGCGSGILDVPVLRRLARPGRRVRWVGVDPNEVECEAFERQFAAAALPGAELEVVAAPFEDYEPPAPFDVVHLVHCLYYLPDPVGALEKARRLVAPGGKLVVFHAPCAELNSLAKRFYDRLGAGPTAFAEDLAALFARRGWPTARARVDAEVDVTPFVDGDPDVGVALRDFIVQADSRRMPEALVHIVDAYLHAVAYERDGHWRVRHPVDVFVIDG